MAEMMAKLQAAEAEAEKLRSELRAQPEPPTATVDELARQKPAKPESRVDGTGGRETLFGAPSGDSWLSDGMEFLVRTQPSEAGELPEMDEEAKNEVNRRLAIGLFGTAVFAALSQISDEAPTPSKPLFFYLVPLVKIRELLRQAESLAEDGYCEELSTVCNQISRGNDPKGNLFAAAAYLDASQEVKAKAIAFDFLELLEKIDYNKYFENMGAVSGAKAAEYSKFSKRAAAASASKLDEFLALMDREQLDAARSQVLPPPPEPEPEPEPAAVEAASGGEGGGFSGSYGEEE